MTIFDKVVAAVTPPESDEARRKARADALANSVPGSWFAQVLQHHKQIEDAFSAIRAASEASSRRLAQKELAVVLNGHSLAEEVVLYPALGESGAKGHMGAGYTEQTAVKVQMALLEDLDPMSQDYLDKLGHIEGAVAHHMYEEEGNWFQDLAEKAPAVIQAKLTARFREEYERYVGAGAPPLSLTQQAPSLATL